MNQILNLTIIQKGQFVDNKSTRVTAATDITQIGVAILISLKPIQHTVKNVQNLHDA
jgi:hypothetical protein